MSKSKTGWFSSSCGIVELEIKLSDAANGSHQGQCDKDIDLLLKKPYIIKQLKGIVPQTLANELKVYGAWEDSDLQDHQVNLSRILWLACCDINEEGN